MAWVSFRQIFPKGFYARSVLLTLLPVAIILTLMTIYYFNGHLRTVNGRLSQTLAREIVLIEETCVRDGMNLSSKASIERSLGLSFDCAFEPASGEAPGDRSFYYASLVRAQLDETLRRETDLSLIRNGRVLDIRVPRDGAVLRVVVERKRAVDINGHIFIVWVVGFALLMVFTALAFLRNHVRSILKLADAAEAFGRGKKVDDFRPTGAREVRAAAAAVLEMRERLTLFAEERTSMLAGVSHDLRTPLARLQLQLAMQEQTEDVLEARADIREMEAMLEEYLAFARGEGNDRASDVDISGLVRETVDLFPAAHYVEDSSATMRLLVRRLSLKRALSNIISNAVSYGERAEIRLEQETGRVRITVDDDGPGIPAEQYEDALKPFARLEKARTQNVPGVGLGLALARDAARSHGGTLSLQRSPLGGLRVEMMLPA